MPKLSFAWSFGKYFRHDEVTKNASPNSSSTFSIRSINRVLDFLTTEALLKVHASGDTSLLTPWLKLTAPMSVKFGDGKMGTFETGHLVLPLMEDEDHYRVFFVCGGLTDDDKVPEWTAEKLPEDLQLKVTPHLYSAYQGVG